MGSQLDDVLSLNRLKYLCMFGDTTLYDVYVSYRVLSNVGQEEMALSSRM
jgi:hypothetical protein